jgi:PleD family two-component response regulator
MTPRETYHQAKIEHFIRQATEFVRMGRYPRALKSVDAVLVLDPSNDDGMALRSRIDTALEELSHRHHENGNGHAGVKMRRGELVLCVDQDERVLTDVGDTLRHHGYRFTGAGSYDEATELMIKLVPDLVISEVNFEAGPRGFDLFLWVRSNAASQVIPFLFHATRIDRDILIAGKRFGVDDFIVKPADGEVVAAAVTQVLVRRRQMAKAG